MDKPCVYCRKKTAYAKGGFPGNNRGVNFYCDDCKKWWSV